MTLSVFVTALMVLAAFILIGAVLLQPSKGGAGGVLGGSSQSLFGSTGGTTFLFRLTMWCAGIIMVGSLFLSWSRIREGRRSVVDGMAPIGAPVNPSPLSTAPVGTAPVESAPATTPPTDASAPAAPVDANKP